ncbi:uncharacterized protein N7459_005012 [Penicillium hispanicum]|uniref:uncharacterized protein n=1 Tax=Penicillium hispanicum TaxID=1080232 RepID=UPI002540AA88|nr:uncharacterized protein N7459_005012 [Penicillium hispanicum]KAJ5585212.1 hypothetical protein N7459_005012 [Penicillium hispanicum]
MPYSLLGRNVLITGGSRGLGALVAQKFAAEGSNIAINYMSNKETANKVASDIANKYNVKTVVIQGDAGNKDACANTVKSAIEQLGGLDVVVSNAIVADNSSKGWTKMTNFADLDAMDDADWDKCWNINVKSSFHLFKAALPTFNANPEGGAFIITSSTAGVTAAGSSLPYAVTKAARMWNNIIMPNISLIQSTVIHLMKCLASSQGEKIRVNAVLPGLLLTEWGQQFSPEKIDAWKGKTALQRLPEVEDTADMYVTIAKNNSMTGQAVRMGMSPQ